MLPHGPASSIKWTPERVRRLRAQRTQEQFGRLVGVPKNTVWRWESGHSSPDRQRATRLTALAQREGFDQDWQLAGSAVLLGDLETGSRHIAKHLHPFLSRSVNDLKT